MIETDLLYSLKNWFTCYAESFGNGDAFTLKHCHTKRVCAESVQLAQQLELSFNDCLIAEIIGLFHDLGRFEQYRKYGTFFDQHSENHALLALTIIERESLLNAVDEAELIGFAIANHNRPNLDGLFDERRLLFSRIIRDADKIDIWHIKTRYYLNLPVKRKDTIEFNLPDLPDVSEAVYASAIAGHSVRNTDIKTLTDLKLLELSWIFDVNFKPSFLKIKSRRYFEAIRRFLPDTEPVRAVFQKAMEYLESRCLQ